MRPYANRYSCGLNNCRYSLFSGRPRLPRSRRTLNTVSASCIAHTSLLLSVRPPGPLRPAGGFPALLGGALLPRLIRGLRRPRARARQAIPRSSLSCVIARLRRPTHLLDYPPWVTLHASKDAPTMDSSQSKAWRRFQTLSGGWDLASSGDWGSGNPAFAISHGLPGAPSLASGPGRRFSGMLLFPSPFGSRSAIQPRNLPSSSSRLCRGHNKAPRGAHPAVQTGPAHPHRRRPERAGVQPGGDRADQPAPLLGAQRLIQRVGDQGVAEQPHLLGPGPPRRLLILFLAHRRASFRVRPTQRGPIPITSPVHGSPAQGQLVLPAAPTPRSGSGPVGPSNRPPQTTAASRHGSHEPPSRRPAARASVPSNSTTAPTRSTVIPGATNSAPNSAAAAASTASTRSATCPIRRNQPRTVDGGRPTRSAARRCPQPETLASNAAPITVTASARRSSTLAGNSTCVRPQPVHTARRGTSRPSPPTPRSRAHPHGANRPPQPSAGHRSPPPHSAVSTAELSTPTVITGCTPMHQDGPSVSAKTPGRAVAYLLLLQDLLTLASHTNADKNRPRTPHTVTVISSRSRVRPRAGWRSTVGSVVAGSGSD